jgi:transposase
MARLRPEEVVTIQTLSEKQVSNRAIARQLGVTEGAVRYHLRRRAQGAVDGRTAQPRRAAQLAGPIEEWVGALGKHGRPANVLELYEHLVAAHGYTGSYKSVLRYVRSRFGQPKLRTFRRVETPPGAQSQTDWGHFPGLIVGGEQQKLFAFVMSLSFSRMPAVVWSESTNQVSWLSCHNGAYQQLGGVAAVNRIDNEKTAIASGAGSWGTIQPTYRAYARTMRFHIDACESGEAQAKGKVEAKVKLSRHVVKPRRKQYDSIEELQEESDERRLAWARRAICPVTGESVFESWQQELDFLGALPAILPEPFDVVVSRPVRPDGLVNFEGHQYPVPFQHAGTLVEVRGCAGKVQILSGDRIVREYRRHTKELLLIDPSCYEGEGTERVLAPPPLGKMGRRLEEIRAMPVEQRPMDLYAALAEVAR